MDKNKKEKYNFSTREPYWQNFWEKERIYEFKPLSKKPLYTIDTPPPTISGSLHLGHIFSYTQAEVISRYKRMAGFNVRYPFGYDNNGLPTERLVEKELGIEAQNQKPENFRQECINIVNKYTKGFKNLWQSIGLSVDWRLEYSTISDEVQKLSQAVFIRLYKKKVIYRQEAPALYCHNCQTSIAQAEVEDKEMPSIFYDLAFSFKSGEAITISTTRPELLPACVAVFVNPKDARYKSFIGREITTPLGDKVKVIADELASIEKGSGAVMCCTFGDETDLRWTRKYKLPQKIIINKAGRLEKVENAQFLQGLRILKAREAMVNQLKKQGYIIGKRRINHNVGVHERCSTPVEIIPRIQWFVKLLEKRDELIKAGEKIKWHPAHMKKRYLDWVTNLKWDWCISRERFFGISIPVYVCDSCGKLKLAKKSELPLTSKKTKVVSACSNCGNASPHLENAVLDTWFTSALTPDINNQHRLNGKFQGKILPMSARPQAHDIIRTWTVYSILMSIYNRKNIPWQNLMISGHILVKKGKKVSKKTGGGKYKPRELIRQHSADAVRYAMCQAGLGKDSYYDSGQVEKGKKLITKLYNSGRFALANLADFDPNIEIKENQLLATDRWIMERMNETFGVMERELKNYEFARALNEFEKFFWSDFTDNYLELIKGRLYSRDKKSGPRQSAQYALNRVYLGILMMIAPFLPHITEEIYHSTFTQAGSAIMQGRTESRSNGGYFYRQKKAKSIHSTQWAYKTIGKNNKKMAGGASLMLNIVARIRKFKSERKMGLGSSLRKIVIVCKNGEQNKLLKEYIDDIISVSRSEKVIVAPTGNDIDPRADFILEL